MAVLLLWFCFVGLYLFVCSLSIFFFGSFMIIHSWVLYPRSELRGAHNFISSTQWHARRQ